MSKQEYLEINELIDIYTQLHFIFNHSKINGIEVLSNSVNDCLVKTKLIILTELDSISGKALIQELKQKLADIPSKLISLSPSEGPAYIHAVEYHLGLKFSEYHQMQTAEI